MGEGGRSVRFPAAGEAQRWVAGRSVGAWHGPEKSRAGPTAPGHTDPPSLGRLRQPPSPKAPRAWRHLAARVVPACVAVVSRWAARARAAVSSPPTRRWRRRATAYVLWQAWVCTVWPAPQLGR